MKGRGFRGEAEKECSQLSLLGPERAGPLPMVTQQSTTNWATPWIQPLWFHGTKLQINTAGCEALNPRDPLPTEGKTPQLWPGSSLKPWGLRGGWLSWGWGHTLTITSPALPTA